MQSVSSHMHNTAILGINCIILGTKSQIEKKPCPKGIGTATVP